MRQHPKSHAVNQANNMFKQTVKKVATDHEKADEAFHANRERLKAERLAREAERQGPAGNASCKAS